MIPRMSRLLASFAVFVVLLGTLLAALALMAGVPAVSVSAAASDEAAVQAPASPAGPPWTLTGKVYFGTTGTEPPASTPMAGVTVRLYCSGNPDNPTGTLLDETTTDSDGWYGLTTSAPSCEWYNIVQTPQAGYEVAGATSVNGTVTSDHRIIFQGSLDGRNLTGNKFWDRVAETTCNSCSDCTAKLNGDYALVKLANNIAGNTCINFGASNVAFDCQNHVITATSHSEMSHGVYLDGRTGATVQKCSIYGFEFGVVLTGTTTTRLLTNTIESNLQGVWLGAGSQNNTLSGNALSYNDYGVRLGPGADHTTIFSNTLRYNKIAVWLASDSNTFTSNAMCKQSRFDIWGQDGNSGNSQSANRCDQIENWNSNDDDIADCATHCTPATTTVCASASECNGKLNGDYGTVTLTGDLASASGLDITGNHLTLDCDGHKLTSPGGGTGISINEKVGNRIEYCDISGYDTGIALRSASLNTLIYNTVYNNVDTGLALLNSSSNVSSKRNTIRNNAFTTNGRYGVSLTDAKNNSVLTNTLTNNTYWGLWVSGNCSNTVTANTAGSSGLPLLYWHDRTGTVPPGSYANVTLCNAGAEVTGLTINNGTKKNDGILLVDASNASVHDNVLTSTVGIVAVGGHNGRIESNRVSASKLDGILVDGAHDANVYDNTTWNNPGFGIALEGSLSGTLVYLNSVASNTQGGIRLEDAGGATLTGNTVMSHTNQSGISLTNSSGVTLQTNDIHHNGYGIYFDGGSGGNTLTGNETCHNAGQDIYNYGAGNSGSDNTCAVAYNWDETDTSEPCDHQCLGWWNRRYGFSFYNPNPDDLSYTRYAETFGEDEVYFTIKICAGVPFCVPFYKCWCLGKMVDISTGIPDPLSAAWYGWPYKDLGEHGTCYGMSGMSLRLFYGRDFVADYDPTATRVSQLSENASYGSNSLKRDREKVHGSQISLEAIGHYIKELGSMNSVASMVLINARNGLAALQPGMVSLKHDDRGHVMNFDTVIDGVGTSYSRIYLYDNNWYELVGANVPLSPTSTTSGYMSVLVDRNSINSWSYDRRRTPPEIWTGGPALIIHIPYSLVDRDDWSLPTSINGFVNAVFGNDGGVEDTAGNTIGYDAAHNWHEDIPGGMALPLPAGDGTGQPPGYLVPVGSYTYHAYGGTASGTAYTQTIMGLGSAYNLAGISTGAATHDRMTLSLVDGNPYHQELGFETNDAQKAFNLSLFRWPDAQSDRRTYRILNTQARSGGKVYFKVTPDQNGVVVANRGTVAMTYDLALMNEMVAPGTETPNEIPVRLIQGLTVQPGEVQTVTAHQWADLRNSTYTVNEESCGNATCGMGEDHVNCSADCAARTCVTPADDMLVTGNTLLCGGEYEIADQGQPGVIIMQGTSAELDCNGARLKGAGSGVGIAKTGGGGRIINCFVENYARGIQLEGSPLATIASSTAISNVEWGIFVANSGEVNLAGNAVMVNGNGVQLLNASQAALTNNLLCPNQGEDLQVTNSHNMAGQDNACDKAGDWSEGGRPGCTYSCAGDGGGSFLYLPLIQRN